MKRNHNLDWSTVTYVVNILTIATLFWVGGILMERAGLLTSLDTGTLSVSAIVLFVVGALSIPR